MRKTGIMISVLGMAAFAALLAWGVMPSGDTVTVRAEENPCLGVAPGPPATYEGLVTINGQPAAAGTELTFSSDSVTWGSTTVATTDQGPFAGSPNWYAVTINFLPRQAIPCTPPSSITVTCDGATDAQFQVAGAGAFGSQAIECTGAAPATATPAATTTAAATVTATPAAATVTVTATAVAPPITGAGGTSGDSSLLWWPLALAAAALTSVAGLATARWARR